MTTFADLLEKHGSVGERRRQVILNSKLVKDGDKFTTSDAVRILSNYRDGVVVTTEVARVVLASMVDAGILVSELENPGGRPMRRYRLAQERKLIDLWKPTKNDIPLGRYYPCA